MKVGIIGASGYAGAELLRILLSHPYAEVSWITSESHTGTRIDELYPHLGKFIGERLISKDDPDLLKGCDAIFTALPHGHAIELAKKAVEAGIVLIDLGPDFRFTDKSVYEKWYKISHTYGEYPSAYGLTELYRGKIKKARLIGNPGCYPTAAVLPLVPLIKHRLIDHTSIIIDAKSGISGAGRSLSINTHFCESIENVKAYNITQHRHTPEIEQVLSDFADAEVLVNFTPHLMPMTRGIFCTCYAALREDADGTRIEEAYREAYGEEYFIRLLGRDGYPSTKNTRGSNFCDIGWHIDQRTGRVIVLSAIDNLVKGAAGQAVQNMNVVFGFDEATGLSALPLYP